MTFCGLDPHFFVGGASKAINPPDNALVSPGNVL